MNIGLIELSEPMHYMVIHGLLKTYSEDSNHQINAYVNEFTYNYLKNNTYKKNIEFHIHKTLKKSDEEFFNSILDIPHQRLHLCTVSKHFHLYENVIKKTSARVFFHIHNIDIWFNNPIPIFFKQVLSKIKNKESILAIFNYTKFAIKQIFESKNRKSFFKKLISKNPTFVTLSSSQQRVIKASIPNIDLINFPSIICERINYLKYDKGPIKLCIPGFVDHFKRDYIGFFTAILNNYQLVQGTIEIELLGYYDGQNEQFSQLIEKLKEQNIKVTTYESYLSPDDYDKRLEQSHILLGNIIVKQSKSGQLKETGTVYNLIRGSRPGLFPTDFQLDQEFHDSCLQYENYNNLVAIISDMYKQPEKLNQLIDHAISLSKEYLPNELLKRLPQ